MSLIEQIVPGENRQKQLLNEARNSSRQSVIYGAGIYAYVLYQYLTAKGIRVKNFAVDRAYKTTDTYMNLAVITIEEVLVSPSDYNIFVGVTNYPLVLNNFKNRGIENFLVVDVPDFLNIPSSFMDYAFVKAHEDLFEQACDVWEDELSKQTYAAAINTKINEDLSFIKTYVRLDHLYFSKTEFPITLDEALLDVGGYNGDSIRDFCKISNGYFRSIISLEPFPKMFADLNSTIKELGISEKCSAIQIGAWNEKSKLSFSNTEMEIDSKILEGSESEIQVDTIDNILSSRNSDVTFIKMDINGAEFNALRGAEKSIQKNKPQIAVKLHVKEDFYRLPILLKTIDPGIKLYLRQRNYMSMMLVLYGVFK